MGGPCPDARRNQLQQKAQEHGLAPEEPGAKGTGGPALGLALWEGQEHETTEKSEEDGPDRAGESGPCRIASSLCSFSALKRGGRDSTEHSQCQAAHGETGETGVKASINQESPVDSMHPRTMA